MRQSICDTYGGTFFEGASCPSEETGICIYREKYCTLFTEAECFLFRGEWNNTVQNCPEGFPPLGACYIDGACKYLNERACQLQSNIWYEEEQCQEDSPPCDSCSQDEGICCIYGICLGRSTRYRDCLIVAGLNEEILGDSEVIKFQEGFFCPETGICSDGS